MEISSSKHLYLNVTDLHIPAVAQKSAAGKGGAYSQNLGESREMKAYGGRYQNWTPLERDVTAASTRVP